MGRSWHRLKRRTEFLDVAASGLRRATPGFVIQAKAFANGPLRIGFTASRKVGESVARNRAKRRLRAAVDKVFAGSTLSGWDFVLIARTETITRDFAVLSSDLSHAVARVTTDKPRPRS